VSVIFKHGATSALAVVTAVTDTQISAISPAFPGIDPSAATPVDVNVVLPGGTLSSPNCWTYTGTSVQPVVTAIMPSAGSKLGGTRVTIWGSGFVAPLQVFFGGGTAGPQLQAQVVQVTFNQIIAITPNAQAAGPVTFPETVPVTVVNVSCIPSGTNSCSSNGAVSFTYLPGMQIFDFTPDHGDASTTVTINGQGFTCPVIVSFGNTQGIVTSCTATQILAKPPSGCGGGSGNISVTSDLTGETATSSAQFAVTGITAGAPAPPSGPAGVATTVTVTGTGLFSPTSPTGISVSATGGTVTLVSAVQGSGTQQVVTLSITPTDPCGAPVVVTLTNTTTGCSATTTFANSTPVPPIATTPIVVTLGPAGSHQVTFSEAASGGGGALNYTWTFTGGASPSMAAGPSTGVITFTCTTANCATATVTVTDSCTPPDTGTTSVAVTPP
jgi:hypothetical protein